MFVNSSGRDRKYKNNNKTCWGYSNRLYNQYARRSLSMFRSMLLVGVGGGVKIYTVRILKNIPHVLQMLVIV